MDKCRSPLQAYRCNFGGRNVLKQRSRLRESQNIDCEKNDKKKPRTKGEKKKEVVK
jgi:hypothetical protein